MEALAVIVFSLLCLINCEHGVYCLQEKARKPPGEQNTQSLSGYAGALYVEKKESGSVASSEPRSDDDNPPGDFMPTNTESEVKPCDITTGSLLIGGAAVGFLLLVLAIGVLYILQKRRMTDIGEIQGNKRCKAADDQTDAKFATKVCCSNLYSDPEDPSDHCMNMATDESMNSAADESMNRQLSPLHEHSNDPQSDSSDYIHMYGFGGKGVKGQVSPPGEEYCNYQSDLQDENVYVIPDADYS